jgi:hypothetical protein
MTMIERLDALIEFMDKAFGIVGLLVLLIVLSPLVLINKIIHIFGRKIFTKRPEKYVQ